MDRLFTLSGASRGNPEVDLWLDTRPEPLREIAKRWFAVMRECGDDVLDLVHDGCPTACVRDVAFGYVNVFKAYVNIGFFRGFELADPAGLLRGSGRHMRHVRLERGHLEPAVELEALIAAAYAGARSLRG